MVLEHVQGKREERADGLVDVALEEDDKRRVGGRACVRGCAQRMVRVRVRV